MSPRLRIALLALVALAGCTDEIEYDGAFAIPSAGDATVGETPFGEPIAYVASRASGLIQALATKQGRFLNDDPTAAYLRGNPLPTGQARTLSGVAAWTPDDARITVFAADQTFSHLLEIPHVTGLDALGPVEPGVSVTEPVASGGGRLEDLVVRAGYATTETWTLTFDGEAWRVEGSRSGRQELAAVPDEPWTSSLGGVSFTVTGDASPGDTLSFETDSGLVEHVLGEDLAPVELAMAPDQSVLAVATWDDVTGAGGLHWWDPESATLTSITLAEGAHPARLTWDDDVLYAADSATSGVWRVAAGDSAAALLPLPWPVSDVAVAAETGRLFLVPVSGRSVFMADLETGQLLDVNPTAPGIDGMDLFSPVRGIATLPAPVRFPSDDDDGVRLAGRVVAISLHRGPVVFMDQATGCLLADNVGPSTVLTSSGSDHSLNVDSSLGPFLQENSSNSRHVIVNPCAGIARAEEWRAVYRAALQAWEVRGALSGTQTALAYEDQRYVSDRGEISFLMLGGAEPSREGMSLSFVIDDGVINAFGDMNGDGDVLSADAEVSFAMPGDPIPVSFRVGPTEGGWRTVDERSYAIVPLEGADAVSRVDPATGLVDALWR